MPRSPQLKIFAPNREYIASCKYAEDAINLAQFRGIGAEVRKGHEKQFVIWRVSNDDDLTGDGNDIIDAELLWDRIDDIIAASGSSTNSYSYTPRSRKVND